MKTKFNRFLIVLSLLVLTNLDLEYSSVFGQGSLAPPGAPGPTMKSLDQIEARTPISSLPYTITTPGSYYITTNLTGIFGANGININSTPPAENVTIDLNGFTLTGILGSLNGISTGNNGHNYVIRNGTLRNWGVDGVNSYGSINCRFEKLQFCNNVNIGLQAGVGSVVTDCEAYSNIMAGVQVLTGDISRCVALNNGVGILTLNGCVVSDSEASGNTGDGINCGIGTIVRSSAAYQNGGNGITTSNSCIVEDCTAYGNASGIQAGQNSFVKDCVANGNQNGGIQTEDGSILDDCVATSNTNNNFDAIGIQVGNNSTVKNCAASGNGRGILTINNSIVKDCNVSSNFAAGVEMGNNSTVDGCCASGNAHYGIYVGASNCQIVGNTCIGNNYYGIELTGGTNRVDGNNVGWNSYFGINEYEPNVNNNITRNFSPGPGYGNYGGNSDYAPYATSPGAATNPWQNFQ